MLINIQYSNLNSFFNLNPSSFNHYLFFNLIIEFDYLNYFIIIKILIAFVIINLKLKSLNHLIILKIFN
jgi:hypothetical protein